MHHLPPLLHQPGDPGGELNPDSAAEEVLDGGGPSGAHANVNRAYGDLAFAGGGERE